MCSSARAMRFRSSYTSRSASSPGRTKRVTVCKTVHPGSIPGVASKEINHLAKVGWEPEVFR